MKIQNSNLTGKKKKRSFLGPESDQAGHQLLGVECRDYENTVCLGMPQQSRTVECSCVLCVLES